MHAANALEAKSQSQNGNDGDNNGNGGNGNGNHGDGEKTEMEIQMRMVERDLMKLMMEVYYPRNEIQKMETELMVPEEEDRIESLMDQKLKGYAIRSAENKRKFERNQRYNRAQQPPFKRQNVRGSNMAGAYTAGGNEGRVYVRPHPLCNKCKLHHVGSCTVKCRSCGKIGHLTRDCKPAVPMAVNQRASMVNQRSATCFECGRGKAYVIGGGDANSRSNVVTDVSYAFELADGRIAETNTMLRGCTIGLLGHPFNIDLMPAELGSFDVIIGMDWLANNHAVIVCDEKITQKYMEKGCQVFLAHVTKKETKVKSKEKRLEDVPIVRKFL
ncbi:putative reverse transcriptase domain-containing protein, partial [Tanacetum coccineum]